MWARHVYKLLISSSGVLYPYTSRDGLTSTWLLLQVLTNPGNLITPWVLLKSIRLSTYLFYIPVWKKTCVYFYIKFLCLCLKLAYLYIILTFQYKVHMNGRIVKQIIRIIILFQKLISRQLRINIII